jgi:hypothetical protein
MMDSGRVVRLATSLSGTGTRRRLVRLLAAMPPGLRRPGPTRPAPRASIFEEV